MPTAFDMDPLSRLLQRFSLSAGVFHVGDICGVHAFARDERHGHLHVIKRGPVELLGSPAGNVAVAEPTLLFLPRPEAHRLVADRQAGADVVCAAIEIGGGGRNPVTDSLPELVLVPLKELPGASALLALMFEEAFADQAGRQTSLDRLCELLLIRMLRVCIDKGMAQGGALSGLADSRLSKALEAIHRDPGHDWDLAELARRSGMSRARFAAHFRRVIGETPASYLASWRINRAQDLLRAGRSMKHVSHEVGYGSSSALTRAFSRKLGAPPMQWLRGAAPGS